MAPTCQGATCTCVKQSTCFFLLQKLADAQKNNMSGVCVCVVWIKTELAIGLGGFGDG